MGVFSPQLSAKRLVPVCRQIATAYDAGIPIIRTLEMLAGQLRDRQVRDIMTTMADDIRKGGTLAGAARAHSRYLPTIFIELLSSGERGGRLDVMFRDLAGYYEDRLSMRREVARMLAYPVFLVCAAWFLLTFAFQMRGMALSAMGDIGGRGVSFEGFIHNFVLFHARWLAVFAMGFGATVVSARLGALKWIWGAVTTFIWPMSSVTRRFGLARFFRSMSLLLGSGVDVMQCIRSSAAVTANPYLERDLLQAIEPVKNGASLYEAFKASRFIPSTALEFLHVGEESGKLEEALRKTSQYQFDEGAQALRILVRVVETLIVLTVASVIGYFIISFYMGLYGGMFNALGI